MSFFPTNANQVQAFAGAMYGVQIGSVTMAQVTSDIAAAGGLKNALNSYYAASFGSLPTATVAATVAANLGLTGDALASGTAYITAQLNGVAAGARGALISDIVNLFSTLASDATFGAAATAWNTKVATAAAYTGAANVAIGSVVATNAVFTLTTGADIADDVSAQRGSLASSFKFSSGNETVNASVGTLDTGDILLDSSTTDNDVLNATVSGTEEAFTATNIETINLTFAAGTPVVQLDNVSGVKAVNVTGSVAGTVDGFAAATVRPTFGINNITKIVTLTPTTLAGTTAAATAEALNVSVSGLSYGTTTATQSGIAIGDTTAGTLETLNLTSTGTTANDFALTSEADQPIGTLNITGDQSVQIRAATALMSGVTINAADNTGEVTLRVERNGATTTATNAANYTGVDNIIVTDSDATTDAAVVASLQSGAKVTLGTSFAGDSVLSLQSATFTALKDSINVVLDNVAATPAGVTITKLDVQNVKALNLTSAGHAASTSTTGANVLDNLVGDFTTITITGDTSLEADLNIDATETATTTTARTVVVDASGMTGTAFVNFADIADSSKVGYTITGTANADTVSFAGSSVANTVNGGAGNDTLTGGDGNDTINAGAGNDTINISYGSDTVTGGEGNDTFTITNADGAAAAVRQVTTTADVDAAVTTTTADALVVVINGQTYNMAIKTAGDTGDDIADDFVADFAGQILAAHGVVVETASKVADASANLKFTGKTDGTTFTVDATLVDGGVLVAIAETATAAGAAAKDINTTITDFAVGDILNLSDLLTSAGVYHEGAAADAANADSIIVLTAASYASAADAQAAIDINTVGDDGVIIFLNSTLGKAQMIFDNDTDDTTDTPNVIYTFDNITTLTGIASTFSADSFILA